MHDQAAGDPDPGDNTASDDTIVPPQPTAPAEHQPTAASPLAAAVRSAERALHDGRTDDAAALLAVHLVDLDPHTAPDDEDTIQAALLWHYATPDHPTSTAWTCYAYHASQRLRGPEHHHTLTVANVYAAELTRHGSRDALPLYRHIIDAHDRHQRVEASVIVRMTLAGALHTFGDCGDAIHEGREAWDQWRHAYDARYAGSILVAIPLLAMLAACGRTIEAMRVLGQVGPALPTPGSTARIATAEWAAVLIDNTAGKHRDVCAGRLDDLYDLDSDADTTRAAHLPPAVNWREFMT